MNTFQAIQFGQHNADFEYKDYAILQQIARLSKKHQRQCENSCNGYGVVNGQMYFSGQIDEYAKQAYGYNVKSSYVKDDISVFDVEIDKIEAKINRLVKNTKFTMEYQHDPRGWTVKVFYNGTYINW
jgi:hypothetical protein